MISVTLCLYICSGITIGLLAAFSAHNRKTGWKKSRTPLTHAPDDIYEELALSASLLSSGLNDEASSSVRDAGEFSSQLINLRGALGEGTSVIAAPEKLARQDEVVVLKGGRDGVGS